MGIDSLKLSVSRNYYTIQLLVVDPLFVFTECIWYYLYQIN